MAKQKEHMIKEQIDLIIEMYKCEEILWNTKHPSYYNKESRLNATNNIIEAIEDNFGVDFTVEQVMNKIQNLRSYYGRETRKWLIAQKRGEEYNSQWMYYNAMDSFLKNHFIPKTVDLQIEDVNVTFSNETRAENGDKEVLSESDSSETDNDKNRTVIKSEPSPLIEAKRKYPSPLHEPSNKSSSAPTQRTNNMKRMRPMDVASKPNEDEDLIFAQYLANEMRKVTDLRTKQLMKLKLQTIIFEAQTGEDV